MFNVLIVLHDTDLSSSHDPGCNGSDLMHNDISVRECVNVCVCVNACVY